MAGNTCLGLVAHVDAGKTTLSEALLYTSGARRTLGRVDHGDAFLDTHSLERARGITIFSKLARLPGGITLVDTPGHADLAAEAERAMPVLDCALLVISGTDGVQAHTLTLWDLLKRYGVPVVLFVNKMDLPGTDRAALMAQLRSRLSPACVDFSAPRQEVLENAALCDEALLESYLETGTVTEGNLRGLVAARKLFPCCFGSALKLTGIRELLDTLEALAPRPQWGREFSARVYKISHDPQGARLTWLKLTGGSLAVRSSLSYTTPGGVLTEKVQQLRLYSGDKFTAADTVQAGEIFALTGLSATWAGQTLGAEGRGPGPLLEPVMAYRICLPPGLDPAQALPRLRLLEEEDPQLHITWENGQLSAQIMGQVQREVLVSQIAQRFGWEVSLDRGRIFYKETVLAPVEGVGHFEPLRHYAEVHLLLEPLPRGSGLEFSTRCPRDVLDPNYQNLVLTHLGEKVHRGVLTGAPITDMRITLLVGRAHLTHTEGGDFRPATYRAVHQGIMWAQSRLLEPWYDFVLTLPTEQIGRAITDIRAMDGEFSAPEPLGECSRLQGRVSAAALGDYAQQVAAYSQGRGQLQLTPAGFFPCHDQDRVVAAAAYDPTADLENTPDSVFCAHGAGFPVPWDRVEEYMHLESGLKKPPQLITRNLAAEEKALDAALRREFGPQTTHLYRPPENRDAAEKITVRPPREQYLIVDGYNMIFAWEDLKAQAAADLDAARRQLTDRLASFAAYKKCKLVLVFDGYRQSGNPGEKTTGLGIGVVYTREGQTGDQYIEELVGRIGPNYAVRVATSDGLVQLASLRSGVLRMSARELEEEVLAAQAEMRRHFRTQ